MGAHAITVPQGECWEVSLKVTPVNAASQGIRKGIQSANVIDLELEVVRGTISDSTYLEICEGEYRIEWTDQPCYAVEVLSKSTLTELPTVDYEYVCNEDTEVYDLHYHVTVGGVPNATPTVVPTSIPCGDASFTQVSYCNVVTGTTWIRASKFEESDESETVLSDLDTGVKCVPVQIDVELDYVCNTDENVYERIETLYSDGALVNSTSTLTTIPCDEDKPQFKKIRECRSDVMHIVLTQVNPDGSEQEISATPTPESCGVSRCCVVAGYVENSKVDDLFSSFTSPINLGSADCPLNLTGQAVMSDPTGAISQGADPGVIRMDPRNGTIEFTYTFDQVMNEVYLDFSSLHALETVILTTPFDSVELSAAGVLNGNVLHNNNSTTSFERVIYKQVQEISFTLDHTGPETFISIHSMSVRKPVFESHEAPLSHDPCVAKLLETMNSKLSQMTPQPSVPVELAHGSNSSVPSGMKAVVISSLSGVTTVDGTFELGSGRRPSIVSYDSEASSSSDGMLPAIQLSGGTWQWSAIKPVGN